MSGENVEGDELYSVGVITDSFSEKKWGVFLIDIYYPARMDGSLMQPHKADAPYPTMIFVHGVGASKEHYTWIGNSLARRGFIVLIFSAPNPFSMNIRQSVMGVEGSLNYLEEKNVGESILRGLVDLKKIIVIGHSFGAGAAIIAGSENPRINAVIALAPPGRTQTRRLGIISEMLAEATLNPIGEIEEAAMTLETPLQIQVGSLDRLCPPSDIHLYYEVAKGPKDWKVIEGGNHFQFMDEGVIRDVGGLTDNRPTITPEKQHELAIKNILEWLSVSQPIMQPPSI